MEMVPWKEIKKNQEWNFINTKDSMQNEKNIVLQQQQQQHLFKHDKKFSKSWCGRERLKKI